MVLKRAVILFLFVSSNCFGQYYYPLAGMMSSALNPVFTNSLVSAYNADGNANDFTGYANGTLTNGASATGTPKVGTYSFSLDGTNDYVDCGTNKWNFTGAFSVSVWVYTNSVGIGNRCIVSSFYDAASTKGWSVRMSSGNKLQLTCWNNSTESAFNSATSLSSTTYQNWVVTVANDKTVKVYLNGTLDNTGVLSNFPNYNTTSSCYIGAQYGFYYWNGNIDALQIWDRELSSTDVTTLYNAGSGLQPQ